MRSDDANSPEGSPSFFGKLYDNLKRELRERLDRRRAESPEKEDSNFFKAGLLLTNQNSGFKRVPSMNSLKTEKKVSSRAAELEHY